MEQKTRIDKWLWAARFYKTRSAAAKAVTGGRARINAQRVKPAHLLQVNDQVRISKGLYEFIIDVIAISDKRGPAKQAQLLYQETSASIEKRESLSTINRQIRKDLEAPKKKPTKRQRRDIIKLRKS